MTAAVVLNFRTPARTILAVTSLRASLVPVSGVIVVDNGSDDGSPEMLARDLPEAIHAVSTENRGFSAGCNMGIQEALRRGAARVLLLNSDVIVTPAMLGELEKAMDADPAVGIVGPVLLSDTAGPCVQSLGIQYSPAIGRMRLIASRDRGSRRPNGQRQDVTAVSGAAMLIKREVFERVGLLDETFFFGFEDLEFCLRARDAGFRTRCVETARVRHEGNASIGRHSPRRIYFATRNHLLLTMRRPAPWTGRWLVTISVLGLNLVHVFLTADVPRLAGIQAFVRGARDHFQRRYGPAPNDVPA